MEIGENERVDVPLLRDPDAFAPYGNKWSVEFERVGGAGEAREDVAANASVGGVRFDKLRLGIQIVGGVAIAVGLAYYSTTVR